jgi:hypothetical protein
MARLNTGYAVRFNRRHARVGHLFQNRFKSRIAVDDADVMGLIRYVHRNPLEDGLVSSLSTLGEFPWCGHGALMGRRPPLGFESVSSALGCFGTDHATARQHLTSWMARVPQDSDPTALADPSSEPTYAPPGVASGETLDILIRRVCDHFDVEPALLRTTRRRGNLSHARAVIAFLAIHRIGVPATQLSRPLGLSRSGVTRAADRGCEISSLEKRIC